MAKTWKQQAKAASRARQHRPFSQGTHQVVVRDSRWMPWLALAVILVILFFVFR